MHIEKKTLRNIFIGVVSCIVLYWILHETERVSSIFNILNSIFAPFVMGASLAFVINVPMRYIENTLLCKIGSIKVRRILSLALTSLGVLLILAFIFWLLIPQLIETIQSLVPKIESFAINIKEITAKFAEDNPDAMKWIEDNVVTEEFNFADLTKKAISMIGSSLGAIFSSTLDVVIGVVFAIYCLFQKETLARQGRRILYAFLPEKVSDYIIRVLRLTNVTFSNFLSGQCVEVCILGCLFAISMFIFRMPYIPLVSVLVAVTAFIPVVGAWVGCVLGAFFILVANPIQAVWFVIMFVILQQIENNLIYPRVVGTSIGLSGMWVLVAVAVGGEFFGVAGMFLMIPLASVIQTLLRELTHSRLDNSEVDARKLNCQPLKLVRQRIKKDKQKEKK